MVNNTELNNTELNNTEVNNRPADAALAGNPVIAKWQRDGFEGNEPAYSRRKIRILGGMQLSGSGNYCASMDLIHQHVLRAC